MEPSQIEARLRQYKGTRDWSISGTWYTAECGMCGYVGGTRQLHRKVLVLKDGDWWNIRAATRSLLMSEAEWMVWPRGLDLEESKADEKLQMQFKSMAGFEKRARLLNEDGLRICGLILAELGPLVDQEMLTWLMKRWLADAPWSEGCAWDWWRVGMGDLETRMKKGKTDVCKQFRIRAAFYGTFRDVIQSMRGEG